MVVKSDPYLIDYGCVRINCFVDDQMRIVVVRLSWNREVLEEIVCDDFTTELHSIIQDLLCDEKSCIPCQGFSDQDKNGLFEVFSRLRKNDIPFLLLEKYNGTIVFRSRNCRFVKDRHKEKDENINRSKFFVNQCEQCINFYTQIDIKYASGRLTRVNSKIENINEEIDPKTSMNSCIPQNSSEPVNVEKEDNEILNASILSGNVAVKPHIRESRLRKRDKRYKDFVVDLGETEQLAVHENTTPAKDDTNEDIENIPNNNRNQQVRRNVCCNECVTYLSGIIFINWFLLRR